MQHAAALFRALSDTTRLRLLRALSHDRFNVSELTAILAAAQSSVSRHLATLKDLALVSEEREAGFVYYRLRNQEAGPVSPLWAVLSAEFSAAGTDQATAADAARMQEVLRRRREEFDPGGAAAPPAS